MTIFCVTFNVQNVSNECVDKWSDKQGAELRFAAKYPVYIYIYYWFCKKKT